MLYSRPSKRKASITVPPISSVSPHSYSLQGLVGIGGGGLLRALADRHGAKPVLIGGLLLQALAIGAFLPVRSLGEFYAVATIFGLAYGGVMSLYAVLARHYIGRRSAAGSSTASAATRACTSHPWR
jgi:MFS family permease